MAQNPLPHNTPQRIKSALKELAQVDTLIGMSERAGIDVSAQKERAARQKEQLQRLKQTFFPNE